MRSLGEVDYSQGLPSEMGQIIERGPEAPSDTSRLIYNVGVLAAAVGGSVLAFSAMGRERTWRKAGYGALGSGLVVISICAAMSAYKASK
jgi:hypothetical protein